MKNAMIRKNLWGVFRELRHIERSLDGDSRLRWTAVIQYVHFAKRVLDHFAIPIKYEAWLQRVDSGELDKISMQLVEDCLASTFWGE